MWYASESDRRGSAHRSAKSRWAQRLLLFLGRAAAAGILPFAAGCSPELYAATAIVVPLVYRHLNQGRPETGQDAAQTHTDRSGIHTPPVRASIVHTENGARQPQAPSASVHPDRSPSPQPATPSPVVQGAVAYREMRWDDATRILKDVIAAGTYTDSELSTAHVLLGAMEYQQGAPQTARTHFVKAYRYDRQTQLSPEVFPPQLVEFYRTVNGIKTP
jgi:hypothetical protein